MYVYGKWSSKEESYDFDLRCSVIFMKMIFTLDANNVEMIIENADVESCKLEAMICDFHANVFV